MSARRKYTQEATKKADMATANGSGVVVERRSNRMGCQRESTVDEQRVACSRATTSSGKRKGEHVGQKVNQGTQLGAAIEVNVFADELQARKGWWMPGSGVHTERRAASTPRLARHRVGSPSAADR